MTPILCEICHEPIQARTNTAKRHKGCVSYRMLRCKCGSVIRSQDTDTCLECRFGEERSRLASLVKPKPVGKPLPHIPTSIYVQHDAIAARVRWSQVR